MKVLHISMGIGPLKFMYNVFRYKCITMGKNGYWKDINNKKSRIAKVKLGQDNVSVMSETSPNPASHQSGKNLTYFLKQGEIAYFWTYPKKLYSLWLRSSCQRGEWQRDFHPFLLLTCPSECCQSVGKRWKRVVTACSGGPTVPCGRCFQAPPATSSGGLLYKTSRIHQKIESIS